jgi:hypothetical protein
MEVPRLISGPMLPLPWGEQDCAALMAGVLHLH